MSFPNFTLRKNRGAQWVNSEMGAADYRDRRTQMTKKAADKTAAGLRDAIAIARGEMEPSRSYVPSETEGAMVYAQIAATTRR
jgi:hypothetical protein